MTTISFYEARTHFSELLDQVARGKTVLITRRGKPAAVLGPPPAEAKKNVRQVIAEMKALRRGNVSVTILFAGIFWLVGSFFLERDTAMAPHRLDET